MARTSKPTRLNKVPIVWNFHIVLFVIVERDIALGFLTALVSDSGKDKTSTAVEVLASMPQPQARSKQPSFTLQGKATKQKELTASLGLKDTPLLRSRQHIPEYRRKQLKALMNSIEK